MAMGTESFILKSCLMRMKQYHELILAIVNLGWRPWVLCYQDTCYPIEHHFRFDLPNHPTIIEKMNRIHESHHYSFQVEFTSPSKDDLESIRNLFPDYFPNGVKAV